VPTNNAEQVREFYRRQGEQRERERIIKLLYLQKLDKAKELIALIKGETE
jgi:hypothetical protein